MPKQTNFSDRPKRSGPRHNTSLEHHIVQDFTIVPGKLPPAPKQVRKARLPVLTKELKQRAQRVLPSTSKRKKPKVVQSGEFNMSEWRLVRPGVRLFGQWMPVLFDYPFRFEGPVVGDTVHVIVQNSRTQQFKVEEDKIVGVFDHSQGRQDLPAEGFLIDYDIAEFNPGHGLTFGDVLFETREEAQEILNDIMANLDKWNE
jgi:hypothetical protein